MSASLSVPATRTPRLYFVNAWVDYTMIGGLSILTFLLLRTFYSSERTPMVMNTAAILLWVGNWPHFSATIYRLYHSRANIAQYPMTALMIPWLLLMGAGASMASPEVVAPAFIKLFLIWSPYHFSGQTLGITLIYARRAGLTVSRNDRTAWSAFIYSTFIMQTVLTESHPEGASYFGITYPGLGLPQWSVAVATGWMAVSAVLVLICLARWSMRQRRMVPPIVILPAITQFVWFVRAADWASFVEFVPFFHSLQYLLIAWSMQLAEKMELTKAAPSRRYVFLETMRWGTLNIVGGAILFYFLPRALAVASGVPPELATGVAAAGVQLHHFFVDGVIWKLKRSTVASPLMINLSDLNGSAVALRAGST